METRKLYYEDPHLQRFIAEVAACEESERGWEILLDATGFYPEGGGQACDLGTLGHARVLDVQQRGEQVIHLCDIPLTVGARVEGMIDYDRRFDLMQQHTGEHIVSGIVHRRFGYHNTGFHVGADVLTVDFDGVIPQEALAQIEWEANRAIWENVPLKCWIPAQEELPQVQYRTKRALPWPVRIVQVPGWDSCACCGLHVTATGQIGLVKIFSALGFRGGTRMEMACGGRALAILNENFQQNRQVSQAFSVQLHQTGEAARHINDLLEAEKRRNGQLQQRLFAMMAQGYGDAGDVVHFEEGLDGVAVRQLADAIAQVCGGVAAVFSGADGRGHQFCLVSRGGNLATLGRALTTGLRGRGGGKANCQQGSISATRAEILEFFQNYHE